MSKKEVYYEFILPNYESLSKKPSSASANDSRQLGQVKDLCDTCPERVITYDALSGESVGKYASVPIAQRKKIKSYLDQYLAMPKYFNLRNYWDRDPTQSGGMSLMVSHSPEVGPITIWTKFKTSDSKIVYCSLMVSSGDFFYGWNLPDDVLAKSGLRDGIVSNKFHSNWYSTATEQTLIFRGLMPAIGDYYNNIVGTEKYVFNRSYFLQGTVVPIGKFHDKDGTLIDVTDANLAKNNITSINAEKYEEWQTAGWTYYDVKKEGDLIGVPYGFKSGNIPTTYSKVSEDLKKDYIDLEVTRRILYYSKTPGYLNYNGKSVPIVSSITDIPKFMSGFGKSTVLSYEPPQEYINNPPLQIPYNKLRYALNDRAPFGDCETVLVMWVADSDPNNVADGDVEGLHDLNWQQYAIPISVRCCFKDATNNSNKYVHDRFLVTYPYSKESSVTTDNGVHDNIIESSTKLALNNFAYRFHIRRAENYSKETFREAFFLPDLAVYSTDYVLVYQKQTTVGYNIQHALFEKYSTQFCKIYVRITKTTVYKLDEKGKPVLDENGDKVVELSWAHNNQQQQIFYLAIDNSKFKINTSLPLCLESTTSANTAFVPSSVIDDSYYYKKWDFDEKNDFYVSSDIIVLFKNTNISTVTGKIKLMNGVNDQLNAYFKAADKNYTDKIYTDLYISPFGVHTVRILDRESLLGGNSFDCIPLGVIDNYINIDGTTYGSTQINKTVIIGFKDTFDYKYTDCLHFTRQSDGSYQLQAIDKDTKYTAYILKLNT